VLTTFHRHHGAGDRYRALSDDDLRRLGRRLPAELIAWLAGDGLCAYADQLLWTVDDRDLEAARQAWLPGAPHAAVFARTAFGSLYLWDGAEVRVVLPHSAQVGPVAHSPRRFLEHTLTEPGFVESSLRPAAVQGAQARAGHLAWNEMYGFQPALALGGSGAPDTVRRLPLVAHLVALAQLAAPAT
jgi:hypothetical protein